MTNRLAIIPARGGSKRIPLKNIANFCGKPMISYILDTALQSKLFKKIHVSTDSIEIKNTVEELGFKIDFMRPTSLSGDDISIMPVLKYVLQTYEDGGELFDEVWLLMACSPLLDKYKLLEASEIYSKNNNRSLLAIAEYPAPIEWAFSMDQRNQLSAINPGEFLKRSQDLERRYFDTGTFAIFSSRTIKENDGVTDNKFIGYLLPKFLAIDIDTQEDLQHAELVFKGMKQSNLINSIYE